MESVSLKDLRRNPIVTKVETTKALRTIIHIPTTLHSVLTGSVGSAISERARNIKISAIPERAPRMVVIVAEILSFFIIINFLCKIKT
jgi:hypothetical protein